MADETRTISDGQTAAESPRDALDVLFLGPGDAIGPYRLVRVVGEGGFGIVFEAERSHPIRQSVALKVLKPGMDSRAVLGRFEQERRSLAVMDHPNLARVIDAGQTDRGLPYFVMELVRGQPITEFCDQRRLSIRQRLELLIPVCEAVHHAHMKGIIHRDLKPANILVADHEGIRTPKVIDFGIAKALGAGDSGQTTMTLAGQMIGTPEYMSPEQANASADIDTRSDVYSLGVVFYEILVGALPFDADALRSGGFAAIQRAIRELPTPRAGTRLLSRGVSSTEIASCRSTSLRDLHRLLRTELEWIPLKALSKERDRRYVSAHALAEDVRSYLAGQPLVAGPESASYRLRKFVGRNRVAVVGAALVTLSLLGGIAGTTYGFLRAQRSARQEAAARARAEASLSDVRSLANSLLFDLNSDIERLPGSTAARKRLIDIGMSYLDKVARENSDDPSVLSELASGYFRLAEIRAGGRSGNTGDLPGALASHDRALAIRRGLLSRESESAKRRAAVAESQLSRSLLLRRSDRISDALSASDEALSLARSLAQVDASRYHRRLLSRALTARSWALWTDDRIEESERLSREALALDEQMVAEDPADTRAKLNLAVGFGDLADLHERAGRLDVARKDHARAVELLRSVHALDPNNTEFTLSLSSRLRKLGEIASAQDDHDAARACFVEAIKLNELVAGADPFNSMARTYLWRTLGALADSLERTGDWTRALETRKRSLEIVESLSAASPTDLSLREDVSSALSEIVHALGQLGRRDEAAQLARRVLQIDREILAAAPTPERRGYVAYSLGALGDTLTELGNLDEAQAAFAESVQIRSDLLAPEPASSRGKSELADALASLGILERSRKNFAASISHLRAAALICDELAIAEPENPRRQEESTDRRESLAISLSAAGSHDEARSLIDRCVAERRAAADSPRTLGYLADALAWRANLALAAAPQGLPPPSARADLTEAVRIFGQPDVAKVLSAKVADRARDAADQLVALPEH